MLGRVCAFVVLPLVAASSLAWAAGGNPGTPEPDLMIGPITTYPAEGTARAACGKDPVVWADRWAGYYYWPREKQYAHTDQGAYACLHNAQKSNYWDTSPLSSMEHSAGRVFPYTPLYVGS